MADLYDLHALPLPAATRPTAVVTLAAGPEGEELHAVTGPFLREYAARVGADFHAITPPEAGPWPLAWKWVVWRLLHRVWERVFYVDADALVRPTCPDVFALVPPDKFGAVDEAPDFRVLSPLGGRWWREEVRGLQKALHAVEADHPFAFNAGVYVASRGHADALRPPERPLPLTFCGEQHLLNERLFKLGVPVARLPGELNARWMWEQRECFDPRNHVVHLSGYRPHAERVAELKREAARWR